jgi:YfiH family protein
MIRPPCWDGAAFTEGADGDIRNDPGARDTLASRLGVSRDWAQVRQVHGAEVERVEAPGDAGEADALWTTRRRLPLAIFTADCFGLVLGAHGAVGVAHAGWRGAAGGVVARLRAAMSSSGHPPARAAIGPGIGPCCFEVGPDVAGEFPGHVTGTSWGTTSVDLPSVLKGQLDGLQVWASGGCTMHEDGWFSHRANGTPSRLATIGWLP